MVNSVEIKNFKSVVDLSLGLGIFNVLIGENGCGKSNILEAIAFGSAASADKLDYEFLGSRGMRIPNPEFIFSAFPNNRTKRIEIKFKLDDHTFNNINYVLTNDSNNPRKWINESKEVIDKSFGEKLADTIFDKKESERSKELEKFLSGDSIKKIESFADQIKDITRENHPEADAKEFFKFIFNTQFLKDRYFSDTLSNYIIFSPEQSSLRKYDTSDQIYPLGIRGEGIFQYLKDISNDKKQKKTLADIRNNLMLLDWYESFELPKDTTRNDFSLRIKDKYLDDSLEYFDQRSTNEGFLFLLFYSTLFISKATPSFFAIDNIDASLNPKLCMELVRNLVYLAKKHKKQVIVTTQNPAILDGLNLKDSDQRLFVVSRNHKGYTRAERIEFNDKRTQRLSEVWTKGFIGGLPSNF